MSTHPILERLLQLKEGVTSLEDLDFSAGSVSDAGPELFIKDDFGFEDEDDEDGDEEALEMQAAKLGLFAKMQAGAGMVLEDEDEEDESDDEMDIDLEDDAQNLWAADGLSDDELGDIIADAESGGKKKKAKKDAKKDRKRSRGKKAKFADSDSDDDGAAASSAAFTPMEEPEFVSTKKKSKSAKAPTLTAEDETLGDALELSEADAGDKEHRKRTLRFHTAKIAATSARRSAARDRRLGGDDDIPYRDRQAARDAALRKNGPKGTEGEDLDGSDWTESDRKRAREVRDEAEDADDGDDGYYDLVKRRKVSKDEAKAEAHEQFLEDKFGSFEDETADGPRALTRAIEKNRGLTPRRAKTGRNPRVKKKLAYEKAKQKVGSQRAVYKGGQSALTGAYSGEKTGISTVSKSRKF
jgi:U3 small nucleolar RNA-associated protein 3